MATKNGNKKWQLEKNIVMKNELLAN